MHLRVGYVVKAFPQLSESFIENEIRVLRARGVDVDVASLSEPPPGSEGPTWVPSSSRHLLPTGRGLLWSILRWSMRRPRTILRATVRALRERSVTMLRGVAQGAWVAGRFERLGVQLVHAHFATDAASAALVAAELLGVPWTFTIHARELYLRTSGLWAKCREADAVVTVCDYNVTELERVTGGRRPRRLEVVRCGVDLDRFRARPRPPARDGFSVVSVGRLVPKKGFDTLIDAAAHLAADGIDVRVDIIGTGEMRDVLQERIDARNLGHQVWLRGAMLPEQVAAAMSEADVFVLANGIAPDGDRDSMPVVTKEAMASGVPVITTDTVANPEMVDDSVGRLVPPNDAHALAAAISELASLSPAQRHQLGMAGRRRVERSFSLHAETAKLHALFEELVTDGRS
jgi:glycosyltransferase involved in cell wall biosynthesis